MATERIHARQYQGISGFVQHPGLYNFLAVLLWTVISASSPLANAQTYMTQTGSPTFNSPEPVEQGFTDAANGNLHLEWDFGSYPQRGSSQPYAVKYVYDSDIWSVGCNTSCSWWANAGTGYNWRLATNVGSLTGINCGSYCPEWVFTDSLGTSHYFPVSGGACPIPNAYATDSSGYMLNLCQTGVYAPDGTLVYSAAYQQPQSPGAEDSNGNYVAWNTSLSSGKDTVGRTLPTIVLNCNGNSSQTCYKVPNSQGGTSTYTVTTASIPVNTNFGQSGITEYSGTITVVQSIALPDNTSYTFKFDCDSSTGNPACGSPSGQSGYYGVLTSMTLPTGGTVTYGYTTFSDSYSNKVRWLNSRISAGGVWTYTPAVISTCSSTQVGCQQKVTVHKPSGASTVYTFTLNNGAWPVQVQSYDSSSNLMSTIVNTYDFSNTCPFSGCHGAAYIRLLTTQTTVPIYQGNIEKQTTYQYDSYLTGNITATKEWGYYYAGSGQASFPSTPDRETDVSYLNTGTNDINRPLSVTTYDHGTEISQTLNTYDSYGSSCPGGGLKLVSGVQNHDDTNFGSGYATRGNLTQSKQWVSGSTYLTTSWCYDITGQTTQQTDPFGNVTGYGYADKFYSDSGANPPGSYTPSAPTNAYVTTVSQPLVGTTTIAYYWGSGKQAFVTDPNAVRGYSHFLDPFDRSTETDYPLCGAQLCSNTLEGSDKTVYTSTMQSDIYLDVGEHKQLLFDTLGRKVSENIQNYPGGVVNIDTVYDTSGRVYKVSHPYVTGSGEVYEQYTYDALDRTIQTFHPDSQSIKAFYGTTVYPSGSGVASQQGSTTTYGWGYPVLSRDEAGQERQVWIDGFGRVIEVDEATGTAPTPGTGSVTISGAEESVVKDTCYAPTQGAATQTTCTKTVWDHGTVSITVNGFVASTTYGQSSTVALIAGNLASAFNGNPNSPVTATVSNATVNLTSKATGAASNYPLSATSSTSDPADFGGPSFYTSTSGSALAGGYNSVPSLQSPVATSYKYDAANHVTQVVQGVQTRTFAYDGLGRPTSISTPEAGTDTLSYTISGSMCSGDPENVCQKTDARGVTTTYYYDALNRIVGKSYTIPQGSNVAAMPNVCTTSTGKSANICYSYDQGGAAAFALGRRTQMVDPSGSETYSYDAAGQVTQLTKVVGTKSYTISYTYNAGGEITQIGYPSTRKLQQSYNAVGQLCEIATTTTGCGSSSSPFATGYSYDPAGSLTGLIFGNGVSGAYAYSPNRSQLSSLNYSKSGTALFGLSYWYQQDGTNCTTGNTVGNNGQIQCITDSADSGRNANYTYDALGRLNTAVTKGSTAYPQWGLSWGYDRYGNRLSQTVTAGSGYQSSLTFNNPGGAQTNHPDGWCFDASGNVLAKVASPCPPTSPNFVYDGENRLVADPTAGATYVYDGNGTRVQKCLPNCTSPTSSTVFIFSGPQDIAEYDNGAAPGSPSREFIYSDSLPGPGLLASIAAGTTTYFHTDHLSWRISTNSSGQIVGQQGSYPFGESLYSGSGNEFVFTSYQRDAESGLDYAMARYYDSMAARFCSADPLGGRVSDPQTWNRYAYVRNDPINKTDPSGQGFFSWFELIGSLVLDYITAGMTSGMTEGQIGTMLATAQATGDLATVRQMVDVGDQIDAQGQQQTPEQQSQTPGGKTRPIYCDPGVMSAMKLAYETAQMKTIVNKSQGLDDPAHQIEGGFPVYQNGGTTKVGDIGYGPSTGWDPQHGATGATAVFHTHPSGSGLPSSPGKTAGEGGSGDTGYANSDQVDNYVVSWNGLSVAKAGGPLNPPKKGWDPWIIKGNGPGDWLKKLKAKCGSK